MTIKVIIPYIGDSFPQYFPLFLKSAEYADFIDFLFVTDLELPPVHPSNVHKVHCSSGELVTRAKEKLGINLDLTYPYKLCDLKPAYGHLFEDLVKDADWWGIGDIDLVLGDLHSLKTEGIFDQFDIISFRQHWLSGSLAFFRNNELNCTLYQASPDWKKVFEQARYVGFDEAARLPNKRDNIYDNLRNGESLQNLNTTCHSFSEVVFFHEHGQRLYFQNRIKEFIAEDELIHFKDGHVFAERGTAATASFLHYHWVTEKRSYKFSYPDWEAIPNEFWVSHYGFHRSHENIASEIADRKQKARAPKAYVLLTKRLLGGLKRRLWK
ncbi:MAG: hypothetical protein MK081_03125 [Flavobacteriales bacterium]|nr:hypothetical protein [Flavobacteriales bacterium]